MSRQMPYQPMGPRTPPAGDAEVAGMFKKLAARSSSNVSVSNAAQSPQEKDAPTIWPKESQETRQLSVPPRSQGPLEWQKPEPGSMGRRTTDEWYSCCKIGQPDGSFKYEVWTREPLTSGMKQLALGLPDFETAKKVAQDDADKHR